jgi:hypothetical protein
MVSAQPSYAAPSKDQCIDGNTQAQDLSREGKLLAARQALRVCADSACPRLVRTDCTQRLSELETAIPSMVFEIKDAEGRDLSAVIVTIDNQPLVDHLDGTPIEIDPGAHLFEFRAQGMRAAAAQFVVHQGDRGRRESIALASLTARHDVTEPVPPVAMAPQDPPSRVPAAGSVEAPPRSRSSGSGSSAQTAIGYTVLTLGLAGLAAGGVTAGLAISKKTLIDQTPDCQQNICNPRQQPLVDNYNQFRTASSIGFIAGGFVTAVGLVVLLTRPASSGSSAGLWLGVASAGLQGRFQ